MHLSPEGDLNAHLMEKEITCTWGTYSSPTEVSQSNLEDREGLSMAGSPPSSWNVSITEMATHFSCMKD